VSAASACDPMRFSEGRKSYLAHLIVDTLRKEGLADIEIDRHVLAEIKRVLDQEHVADTRIDALVRRKIASLSRRVPPGSTEWDVLYRQYYAEELRKTKPRRA
jgi:hypothetical protein